MWFTTAEAIPGHSDGDASNDVYERVDDGVIRKISAGDNPINASFHGASANGDRVWFRTTEAVTGDDLDATNDIYERNAAGAVRLVTPGTATGTAVQNRGSFTPDGSRLWFDTAESLIPAEDPDTALDIYEVTPSGGLTLLTPGTADPAVYGGATTDGSRIWFETTSTIAGTGDDDGGAQDVYERRSDGTTVLVSGGSSPANDADFSAASSDGTRVLFSTTESLLSADQDTAEDLYQRLPDGSVRLISAGSANIPASRAAASADGTRVWYSTLEQIGGTADTDAASDLYERSPDGTTLRVTPGNAEQNAIAFQASDDGSRLWYVTREAVPGTGDADGGIDVFERTLDGAVRVIGNGATDADASLNAVRLAGARLFVTTAEALPGTGDADAASDIFEVTWSAAFSAAPTVTGTPAVGQALSCAGEQPVGDGLTPTTRQWLRAGAPIAGATAGSYTVVPEDAGQAVSCRTTVSNPLVSSTSDSAGLTIAPFVQRRAQATGFPIVGTRLTCAAPILGSTARTTVWLRGTRRVGVGARYLIRPADLGKRLTCRITATGPGGSSATTSTAKPIPAACRVPATRGRTVIAARTLLGNRGVPGSSRAGDGNGRREGPCPRHYAGRRHGSAKRRNGHPERAALASGSGGRMTPSKRPSAVEVSRRLNPDPGVRRATMSFTTRHRALTIRDARTAA